MATFQIDLSTTSQLPQTLQILGSLQLIFTSEQEYQIDGIIIQKNQTLLIKNELNTMNNGIYLVKNKKLSFNFEYLLERILLSEINRANCTFYIKNGQINAGKKFILDINSKYIPGINHSIFTEIINNGTSLTVDSNAGLLLISSNFLTQFPSSLIQNGYLSNTSFNTFQNYRQNKLITQSPLSLNEITNTLTLDRTSFQNKLITNVTLNLLQTTNSLSVNTNVIQNKLIAGSGITLNEITNNISVNFVEFLRLRELKVVETASGSQLANVDGIIQKIGEIITFSTETKIYTKMNVNSALQIEGIPSQFFNTGTREEDYYHLPLIFSPDNVINSESGYCIVDDDKKILILSPLGNIPGQFSAGQEIVIFALTINWAFKKL